MPVLHSICRLAGRVNRLNGNFLNLIRFVSAENTNLKEILRVKIRDHEKEVKEFRTKYGSTKVCDIYGGMRGIKALVTETSVLDPQKGIEFRNYTIPQIQELLPKAENGNEPLPEGLYWLLLTGDIPTNNQVKAISRELAKRADLPSHVVAVINAFPPNLHPMAQFVSAIASLNTESKFAKAYSKGIPKSDYWEFIFEDALDLIAKIATIAATIFRNLYRDGTSVGAIDLDKDYGANFASMLGFDDPLFTELIRLYLTLHSDHEGGNVSAHAVHLVGSALSDPYLAFSAGMAGLAGPLHGLASQEVLMWLNKLQKEIGDNITKEVVNDFIWKTLNAGQVVPGFGHAVLRVTDPRYIAFREFALQYIPDDKLVKLAAIVYEVTTPILLKLNKVKNPYANVDAHSGVLLQHFSIDMAFYTVLFGVSRALGTMAQLIWDRAIGMPIERPKSHSFEGYQDIVKKPN